MFVLVAFIIRAECYQHKIESLMLNESGRYTFIFFYSFNEIICISDIEVLFSVTKLLAINDVICELLRLPWYHQMVAPTRYGTKVHLSSFLLIVKQSSFWLILLDTKDLIPTCVIFPHRWFLDICHHVMPRINKNEYIEFPKQYTKLVWITPWTLKTQLVTCRWNQSQANSRVDI